MRPSWKDRYPLTAMEDYVQWRRDDGLPYDPWLRVHLRSGGLLVKVCPRAMTIEGRISDWEEWTGLKFFESGQYIVQGALVPVRIDLDADRGRCLEPNVWIHHSVDEG